MEYSSRVIATAVFLVTACVATIAVLGPIAGIPPIDAETVALGVILFGLIVSADFFEVDAPLASVRVTVSVSAALCFASALTLGPVLGALIAGLSAFAVEAIQRRELIKTVVNTSNYVFSTFIGGMVYIWLADTALSPVGSFENVLATILAASAYTAVDTGSIALVISQVVGYSPFHIWRANFRSAIFEHVSLPTMGIMIPVLQRENVLAIFLVIIPLLGPYLAFRNYRQVHEETRATLGVLADMLDRRDPYTAEHSQRVSQIVEKMLEHYPGISFENFEVIITAARIHDLGKVTTSDATLMKPGKLDPDELEEMRRHSVDGAEILSHISIFQEAATIIRHHHERWDGKGYPDGLAGEEIPVGCRLIAVADTYDAMTTDRPYRKALPHSVAISEIRRQSGTQFEPLAAEAFFRAMNEYVPASSQSLQEARSTD